MQLGMIGLGRMGGNIVRRLMRAGHSCVVYDRDAKAVAALVSEGASVIAEMERRISNDLDTEIANAVDQIGHITRARLARKFEQG